MTCQSCPAQGGIRKAIRCCRELGMNVSEWVRALGCSLAFAVQAASLITAAPVLSASTTINDQGTCSSNWDASTRTPRCASNAATPPAETTTFTCQFAPADPVTVGTSLPLMVSCTNGTIATVAWSASGPGMAAFANGVSGWGGNSVVFSAAGTWTITAIVTSTSGGTPVTAQAVVQAT